MSIDFKKTHRELFAATPEPTFLDVPELSFLMVDGTGDPNSQAYLDAVGALYRAAYRIRGVLKATGLVYTVPPLQGRWSDVGDGRGDRSRWRWTMMLMQPPEAAPDMLDAGPVRLETYAEGPAAQILHRGPYREETETILRLLDHIRSHGWKPTGLHHEIYLSDPRRTEPAKLKTIIRYGVTHDH